MRLILLLAAIYAGHPLTDALHALEAKGLRLIYSSDVVTPSMLVKSEPRAANPRQVLDELLREQHLHAEPGPQESLVIVRDRRSSEKAAPKTNDREAVAREQMPVKLEKIVVTPSEFTLLGGTAPEQRRFLSREEVRRLPHLSDDIYRAISRIPGTATTDVSARFNIRGGAEDEVEVVLDGMQVYDPFHLRDLFRVFSTIDAEAIGSVEILTGGYPAEYGERMSGVIDLTSVAPSERHSEVGISLLATRILTSGLFGGGRGEYLVSLRRGYLREVLQLVSNANDVDPIYYDLLGKMQWQLSDRTVISGDVLASHDRLKLIGTAGIDGGRAKATYDDAYAWVNARTMLSPRLYMQNVAGVGRMTRARAGTYGGEAEEQQGSVDEHRRFAFVALKNDSTFDVTSRNLLKFGATVKRVEASYRYIGDATIRQSLFNINGPAYEIHRAADLSPSGNEVAIYVADRVRFSDRLVAEVGGRWERRSYTPDRSHFAPRVNVAYSIGERTAIRAAWGEFYQAQNIGELQVPDGVTQFSRAQRSEHRVVGLQQLFTNGFSLRAEVYEKRLSSLMPRYENLFDAVTVFPELKSDRVRFAPSSGTARGVELLLRSDSGGPVTGTFSVTTASVKDIIDGRSVPRGWDQRTALAFSVNYRRGDRWNFNVAGSFHTGWPTTSVGAHIENEQLVIDLGELNGARLPSYRRVDFRVSRNFSLRHGTLITFADLYNALNNANVTRVQSFTFDSFDGQTVTTARQYESIVGVIPSFGITYQF